MNIVEIFIEPRDLDGMMMDSIGEMVCADQIDSTLVILKGWCRSRGGRPMDWSSW
jgi:hypothetical protein